MVDYAERLRHWAEFVDESQARKDMRSAVDEIKRLRAALQFYANPEVYKPHPHGIAFDCRDLSYVAIAALGEPTPQPMEKKE